MSAGEARSMADAVRRLAEGRALGRDEAEAAFADLLEGRAGEALAAAFLMGMRVRGETAEELAGCARSMRRHAVRIHSRHTRLVDTCGTGGDGCSSANVSTLAALVVAGAGVAVAKHGNRSVSSRCGSADLLETLGVSVDLEPEQARRCLDECGIGFLFAPRFHPAMKNAAPVRRALGVPTVLNLLGPLSNPGGATRQLVGVYDPRWLRPFAETLRDAGVEAAWVVHGEGMDELSPGAPSRVVELNGSQIRELEVDPRLAGIAPVAAADLRVEGIEGSASVARDVLEGREGPVLEAVALNGGAALLVAGEEPDLAAGVRRARRLLREGAARAALDRLVSASRAAAMQGGRS
jgi:anthranilate phosphoribosyltransferase